MDRCWILVGMMGAGKSSVARALAEKAGREHVDTDVLLQQRFGRSISQIFAVYGEEAFRDHEHSVLKTLQPQACVLSTGGGIVLRDDNWSELRRLGTSVYLQGDAALLAERLRVSRRKRPLLETDAWEERLAEIMDSRQERYAMADVTYPIAELTVEEVADRILTVFSDIDAGAP